MKIIGFDQSGDGRIWMTLTLDNTTIRTQLSLEDFRSLQKTVGETRVIVPQEIICMPSVLKIVKSFLTKDDVTNNLDIVSKMLYRAVYKQANADATVKTRAINRKIPDIFFKEFVDNMYLKRMDFFTNVDPLLGYELPPSERRRLFGSPPSERLRLKIMLSAPFHRVREEEFRGDLNIFNPNEYVPRRRGGAGQFGGGDPIRRPFIEIQAMDSYHFIVKGESSGGYHIWSLRERRSKGVLRHVLGQDFDFVGASMLVNSKRLVNNKLLVHGKYDGAQPNANERLLQVFRQVAGPRDGLDWEAVGVELATGFKAFDTAKHQGNLWYVGSDPVAANANDGTNRLYIGKVDTSDDLQLHQVHTIDLDQHVLQTPHEHSIELSICNKICLAVSSNKYGLVLYDLERSAHRVAERMLFGKANPVGDILYVSGPNSTVCRCKVLDDLTLEEQQPGFENIVSVPTLGFEYFGYPATVHVDFQLGILVMSEGGTIRVFDGMTGGLLSNTVIGRGADGRVPSIAMIPGMGYAASNTEVSLPKLFFLAPAIGDNVGKKQHV